jgi:hypothetical protein
MEMFRAAFVEPPFGARMPLKRAASALGWVALGIVEKLDDDVRVFSDLRDERFQVRLPISPAYEDAP